MNLCFTRLIQLLSFNIGGKQAAGVHNQALAVTTLGREVYERRSESSDHFLTLGRYF